MLEQVLQSSGRCPLIGNIKGEVCQGSEQPHLVEVAPACCRRVGLDDL